MQLTIFYSRFIHGHAILISLITMSLSLTVFMTVYFRRENARRDAILNARNTSLEELTDADKCEEREKGDDAIFYRYTI